MRLKTLEIKGFKSFADKSVIHFQDNITGVVGPNGCGKSNVVDSIRWVLGEQRTRSLRLDKMDSVIFNGTSKRRQSGTAEVSLTFENTKGLLPTEFSTVTVTRMLYRTGESEYRLNGVTCRLRDITGLLMDTGISSDSYAIIELGMIGDILSNKDNIRKKLFDQAAGISKYKKRKRETLSKLKGTDADLERVEDLLHEIEGNLNSLEKQARKTERYYKLKNKYREHSLDLAAFNLKDFKENSGSLKEQMEEFAVKKTTLEKEIEEIDQSLSGDKDLIQQAEEALREQQKALNEHVEQLQVQRNEKNVLGEKLRFVTEKKENLQRQIESDNQKVQQLEKEIQEHAGQEDSEKQKLSQITQKLEQLRENTEKVRKDFEEKKLHLQNLDQSFKESQQKVFEQEKLAVVKTTQKENLLSEITDSASQSKNRKQELDSLRNKLEELTGKQSQIKEQLQGLEAAEQQDQAEIKKRGTDLDELLQEYNNLSRERDVKQSEYDLTKSLVDNLEGFPESIKFLKTSKNWQTDAPLLSDVLGCQDGYKVALENYLGDRMNYYVVKSSDAAFSGVSLLHSNKKGKANFFVLNEFSASGNQHQNVPNAIPAIDIIETSKEYAALAKTLLTDVYILQEGQEAFIQNGVSKYEGCTFLTKDGHAIRRNGVISGGSVGAFEGKRIGRVQNLEKIKTEIDELSERTTKLEDQIAENRERLQTLREESREKQIRHLQQQASQQNNQVIQCAAKVENLEIMIQQSENKSSTLNSKIAEMETNILQLVAAQDSLKNERDQKARELETFRDTYNESSKLLEHGRQQFNAQNIEFHKQQNLLNSVMQNLVFKTNELKSTSAALTNNSTAIKAAQQNILELQNEYNEAESKWKSLVDERAGFEKTLAVAEKDYYAAKGKINEIDQELREKEKQKQKISEKLIQIRERISRQEIEVVSIKERLSIEFETSIEELMEREQVNKIEPEEMDRLVTKWKKRLENYGPINPMAMEAFQEIKERYDFIVSQRQDLFDAKETLQKTMAEIEETASSMFMESFEKARANFHEVFRMLFHPGDTCDLTLSDPDDPLDADINIMAKPKGKRPQTIDQLSGGEKSLTALALIFSLYLLKPAPFCVLDEVDAPLDDMNIDKFNNIIRKFSQESQFIIVTHNKNTMASTDVIYGVTMAEEGVSSVVPVDFRALKHDGTFADIAPQELIGPGSKN